MPSTIETAIHEAAHALTCHKLLNGVESVTILSSESEGTCLHGSTVFKPCKDWTFESICICALAGPVAEAFVRREKGSYSAEYDLAKLSATAKQISMDEVTFKLHLEKGIDAAESFVEAHWPAILSLADTLIEKKTLTGAEVEELLRHKEN